MDDNNISSSNSNSTGCVHINPNIFALENKPKAKLCHEIGAGSPCLKCDNCTGLDLHYWRKMCKICSCRMDDHDITEVDHGKIIIGRLFDFIPDFERKLNLSINNQMNISNPLKSSSTLFTHSIDNNHSKKVALPESEFNVTIPNNNEEQQLLIEYAWVPTTDHLLADKYFNAIPFNERPIVGSEGAVDRRRKLQYQLPQHDTDLNAAKSIRTEQDRLQHNTYLSTLKEKIVGIGQLIECNNDINSIFTHRHQHQHSLAPLSPSSSSSFQHNVDNDGATLTPNYGRCVECGEAMKNGDVAIFTDHGAPDELWHPNCFRCCKCHQRLVDMLYFYKDGHYYCGRHFGDSVYPRCSGCDELIFSQEYTYAEEKNWHFDHFCCFGCDLQLGGHRYMMRNEQPYCFNCYMQKFARICHSCGHKIAPDQQRISFKHLHWHAQESCFQCKNCAKVLLNEKFVTKNEEVFCSTQCKKKFLES